MHECSLVYLVYKINHTEDMDTNRLFKMVMNKGGFKVFKREINNHGVN